MLDAAGAVRTDGSAGYGPASLQKGRVASPAAYLPAATLTPAFIQGWGLQW